MLKKVILQYSGIGHNSEKIRGRKLGEINVQPEIIKNKRLLRAYAYIYFPEELNGKEKVEVSIFKLPRKKAA